MTDELGGGLVLGARTSRPHNSYREPRIGAVARPRGPQTGSPAGVGR